MKKKIILPSILALSILVVGILASGVSAKDASNYPPIVQKIAEHFNLDVSEVEEVFDEERDERRAESFARFADRLDDLVFEGKLIESQKEEILDKHEEMQDAMEEIKNLPAGERRKKMQTLREGFKNLLEKSGLDLREVVSFDI